MELNTRFDEKLFIVEKKVIEVFCLKFQAAFNGVFKNRLCEHNEKKAIKPIIRRQNL